MLNYVLALKYSYFFLSKMRVVQTFPIYASNSHNIHEGAVGYIHAPPRALLYVSL